jgi:ABC-type transport system substrate-binding protein
MRQVFTSPRLENVEGAARLLNEHGIETYISNARSYKGNRRSNYSYTELARGEAGAQAALWIVLPNDITRARQLLREAGLIETTRPATFLPAPVVAAKEAPRASPWPMRIRLLLLAGIAIGAMLVLGRAW